MRCLRGPGCSLAPIRWRPLRRCRRRWRLGSSTVVDSGGDAAAPDILTAAERALTKTLSPLPAVPADPTSAVADNALAAVLGQMLFFDKSYSGPLTVGADSTIGAERRRSMP